MPSALPHRRRHPGDAHRRGDVLVGSPRKPALSGRPATEARPLAPPRRLLLAQTSFLGDVVLTTALWRTLRDGLPECEIFWLVRPDAAPIVASLAGPERVLVFEKRGADAGLGGMRAVAARLAARRFDAAIAVQRSLRTSVVLALAGIPERVGFAGAPGSPLYHHRVAQHGMYARDRLVALARPFGLDPRPKPLPELVVDPAARAAVDEQLAAAGVAPGERLLVLAPGAAWETKRWPAARFAEAASALVPAGLDRVLVVGTPGDRGHAATIAAACARAGGLPPVVDLTGRTDTADLVAVLGRAALLIANDSAPGHVAAALARPVVSVFGPTVPAQGFAPLGPRVRIAERRLRCRPCSRHGGLYCPIGTHECLADLPAALVVALARELLDGAAHERDAAYPLAGTAS